MNLLDKTKLKLILLYIYRPCTIKSEFDKGVSLSNSYPGPGAFFFLSREAARRRKTSDYLRLESHFHAI